MPWNFSQDRPIFQQIVDIIVMRILNGEYKTGDKLLPVRDFAVEAGVNPNTMQRALTEVENMGLIYTKRGDGRYVGENSVTVEKIKSEYVLRATHDYISSLKALGLQDEMIIQSVCEELKKQKTEGRNL